MRHVANCSHTSVVLLSCVRPHCASSRPIGCNASGNVSRSEVVQGGEDAQADIPRISEVKATLLRLSSQRDRHTFSIGCDPVRLVALIGLYRAWRWYGHTRRMQALCQPQRCNVEGSRSSGTGSGRRRGTVQHPSPWWRYSAAKRDGHRSISPNTMSSEPMIAATSPSMCPRVRKSIACKCAKDGARILHL